MHLFRHTSMGSAKFPADFTVIDIETTGLSADTDCITEVAAVRVRSGSVVDEFSSLVHDANAVISGKIARLTGISQNMIDEAPEIETELREYLDFIGSDIVVGHNVRFDIGFLNENSQKLYGRSFDNRSIDTCQEARNLIPEAGKYSLEYLTDFLEIDQNTHHRALADCYSTKALYDILASRDN